MNRVSKKRMLFVWPLVVCVGQILSGIRAKKSYQSLQKIVPTVTNLRVPQENLPAVSIVIPARNEAKTLPYLLESLLRQNYSQYEIIVVDDASNDETPALVQSYRERGVRLISTDGPPRGWTGKNHACWVGAGCATYPWLLFIDADTWLAPQALRSTLSFVHQHDIPALSLFPRQYCETFWERLLLPFAYQQYFVGINGQATQKKAGPALANGQYFLVRRDIYLCVGGHAASANSIVDDVALATRLKQSGITPLACNGDALVSVRMYTNLQQIANGFGKNSYPYLQNAPFSGLQTASSTTLAAAVAVLFIDAYKEKSRLLLFAALLAYVLQVANILPWLKMFRINRAYALFAPLSACMFLLIALNSLLHTLIGRSVTWKGRSYQRWFASRVSVGSDSVNLPSPASYHVFLHQEKLY